MVFIGLQAYLMLPQSILSQKKALGLPALCCHQAPFGVPDDF